MKDEPERSATCKSSRSSISQCRAGFETFALSNHALLQCSREEEMGVCGFRKRGLTRRLLAGFEVFEPRELLASVTVSAGQAVRSVAPQLLGVNLTWWDANLNTSQTEQRVANRQAADRRLLGQPARRGPTAAGRRPQLPAAGSSRPIQHPVLGGWQRRIWDLGN